MDEIVPACLTEEFSVIADEDGTVLEREANFFEIRNWVLDKYYAGLTTPQRNKTLGHKLLDDIMAL